MGNEIEDSSDFVYRLDALPMVTQVTLVEIRDAHVARAAKLEVLEKLDAITAESEADFWLHLGLQAVSSRLHTELAITQSEPVKPAPAGETP